MWLDDVDYGITITECYGKDDKDERFKHPVSSLTWLHVHLSEAEDTDIAW
jgi:hypothetical protein